MRVPCILAAAFALAACATTDNEEAKPAGPPIPPEASCPTPVFPAQVIQSGLSGTTQVAMEIDPAGKVAKAEIVQRSGPTPLHAAADDAVRAAALACKFSKTNGSGTRNGVVPFSWKAR